MSRKHQGAIAKEFKETRRTFETSSTSTTKQTSSHYRKSSPSYSPSYSRNSRFDNKWSAYHKSGGSNVDNKSDDKNKNKNKTPSSPLIYRPFRSVSASPNPKRSTYTDYVSLGSSGYKPYSSSYGQDYSSYGRGRSLSPRDDRKDSKMESRKTSSPLFSSSLVRTADDAYKSKESK